MVSWAVLFTVPIAVLITVLVTVHFEVHLRVLRRCSPIVGLPEREQETRKTLPDLVQRQPFEQDPLTQLAERPEVVFFKAERALSIPDDVELVLESLLPKEERRWGKAQ